MIHPRELVYISNNISTPRSPAARRIRYPWRWGRVLANFLVDAGYHAILTFVMGAALALSTLASAGEHRLGELVISDPWARASAM